MITVLLLRAMTRSSPFLFLAFACCGSPASITDAPTTGTSGLPGGSPSTSVSKECVDSDGDRIRTCDGDCDDNNPDVMPGAPRRCDGVDNDCDGASDCEPLGTIHLPGSATWIRAVSDTSGLGHSVTLAGDLNGDLVPDLLAAADGLTGRLFLLSTDLPSSSTSADAFASVPGWTDYAIGDVTGDGAPDVAVLTSVALGIDTTHIYAGPLSGTLELADATATAQPSISWNSGLVIGDFDGDGVDDLAGTETSSADVQHGIPSDDAVWVLRGPIVGDLDSSNIEGLLYSEVVWPALHTVSGRHDLTGDGVNDLLVADSDERVAYVVNGLDAFSTSSLQSVAVRLVGWPVGIAGDVDGDGHIDLQSGDSGDATIHFGPFTADRDLAATAGIRMAGVSSIGSAGDFDGDGHLDLVAGSLPFTIVYGPIPEGSLIVQDFDRAVVYERPQPVVWQDWAALGDVDGDGASDLAIGSADPDSPGVYLLFGAVQGL